MNDGWYNIPNMVSDGDSMLIDGDWPKSKKCNISASNKARDMRFSVFASEKLALYGHVEMHTQAN